MADAGLSLTVRDLRVTYGAVQAVRGVDLDVRDGEAVALLGPNGAGKSSTLRAISRLVSAEGTIDFAGTDLRVVSQGRRDTLGIVSSAVLGGGVFLTIGNIHIGTGGAVVTGIAGAAAGAGWAFQSTRKGWRRRLERPEEVTRLGVIHVLEGRQIFPNLTVDENLAVARTARSGRTARFEADDVYDLFPSLAGLRGRGGWALSGGEQQMLAIGRALMASPRMLLLDEPSLGLAPLIVDAVYEAIDQVKAEVPILLVEQNTTRALALCDRAYVMSQGKIVLAGSAAELSDRQALMDSYLGQTDAHR